jgi:integrase
MDAFLKATDGRAMATRRSYWKCLMRFMAWLRKRGVLHKDVAAEYLRQRDRIDEPLPWRTRAGARELGRGKGQLRNQAEVEAYLETALGLALPNNVAKADRGRMAAERRVASTLPLLCGLASGEVLHLKLGDIDLAAGIGYVRDAGAAEADGWHVKTAARNGEWEIPQVLRADLVWLTEGGAPDAFLLHDDCNKPHTRGWLRDPVVNVCGKASVEGQPVRKVCPHGLRGTHATLLRVLLGRGIGDIADALRHGDSGRTATRHYVGAPERRAALRVIVGGIDEARGSSGTTAPGAGRESSRISSRGAEQVGIGG